jgi:hypothetical protein
MNRLIVRTQIVGRRSLADTPIEIADAGPVQTVRDLLDAIVRSQVDAFRTRKQEARVLRILTEREIADGREAGRSPSATRSRTTAFPIPNRPSTPRSPPSKTASTSYSSTINKWSVSITRSPRPK